MIVGRELHSLQRGCLDGVRWSRAPTVCILLGGSDRMALRHRPEPSRLESDRWRTPAAHGHGEAQRLRVHPKVAKLAAGGGWHPRFQLAQAIRDGFHHPSASQEACVVTRWHVGHAVPGRHHSHVTRRGNHFPAALALWMLTSAVAATSAAGDGLHWPYRMSREIRSSASGTVS